MKRLVINWEINEFRLFHFLKINNIFAQSRGETRQYKDSPYRIIKNFLPLILHKNQQKINPILSSPFYCVPELWEIARQSKNKSTFDFLFFAPERWSPQQILQTAKQMDFGFPENTEGNFSKDFLPVPEILHHCPNLLKRKHTFLCFMSSVFNQKIKNSLKCLLHQILV